MLVTEFGDNLIQSCRQWERDLVMLTARNFQTIIPTVVRNSKAGGRTSIRARLKTKPPFFATVKLKYCPIGQLGREAPRIIAFSYAHVGESR
jgi:hypothetical protein